MNAKPILAEVKARDSQLSIADLKDRFRVADAKWLVWRKGRNLLAWADTRKNRKLLASLNREIISPVSGVSRNSAVKMVRRQLELAKV